MLLANSNAPPFSSASDMLGHVRFQLNAKLQKMQLSQSLASLLCCDPKAIAHKLHPKRGMSGTTGITYATISQRLASLAVQLCIAKFATVYAVTIYSPFDARVACHVTS